MNVYGIRPRRFVDVINSISDAIISDHVRPLLLCIVIICFRIRRVNQS